MRSWVAQVVLSLAALIGWPLLGAGARAHGSYLPLNPRARPVVFLDALSSVSQADGGAGVGDADDSNDAGADRKLNDSRSPSGPGPSPGHGLPWFHLPWSVGLGQCGAGCGAPSGPPTGGTGVSFLANPGHAFQPPELVRWLSTEEVLFRPPAFPSRLFRPPRVA